ncbi:MAG TPA: hypothetical protein VLV83_26940 [Acidobacteriota bacterium]|nr:hypothetical protein [Acidobacteriota bacterium]
MKKVWIVLLTLIVAAACGTGPGAEEESATPQDAATQEAQEPSAAAHDEEVPPLLVRYGELQQALAADQLDAAKSAASQLAEASQGEIARLAQQAAESSDLATLREAFIALSDKIIEEVGAQGPYKVAYCPMANNSQGARWLQKDGAIRNPYYGSEMLECGYFPTDSQ